MSNQSKPCPECGHGIMPHRTMCFRCEINLINRATNLHRAGVVLPNRQGVLRRERDH